MTDWPVSWSSALVGSSLTINFGLGASAQAMATRGLTALAWLHARHPTGLPRTGHLELEETFFFEIHVLDVEQPSVGANFDKVREAAVAILSACIG